MILPDQIIKSSRKTISLTVLKDGSVVVRVPSRISGEQIRQFVMQKQDWLVSKVSAIKSNQDRYADVLSYNKFLLYGNMYALARADVAQFEIHNGTILCPKKLPENKILHALTLFYKRKAKEVLIARMEQLQTQMKLSPSGIKISNSKGRWGSCNSNGIITLNWRVIMLPPSTIDYVLVHELCHLVEMNHSKRFWDLVTAFLPNNSAERKAIKEYGFLLELYR
jgi:hypothetical protein